MNALWLLTGVAAAGIIVTEVLKARARKRQSGLDESWIGVIGGGVTMIVVIIVYMLIAANRGS